MTQLRRGLTGAVPVTAGVLVLGAAAALLSPSIRSGLSDSFQRQPKHYVELYFTDVTTARACAAVGGRLTIDATLTSHLAAATSIGWTVTTTSGTTTTGRATGSVATNPGRPAQLRAAVAVPTTAYTVSVGLTGRPEHLSLNCTSSGSTP